MEKINCIGCGATLQYEDNNQPGYIPKEAFIKGDFEHMLCQRCHQIKNYNKAMKNEIPIEKYREILKAITKKNALFVYVVDIFSLDSTLNNEVIDYIKNKDVILVCNKIDLLPKSLKENKLKTYVRKYAKTLGLKVKEIVMISVSHKFHIDEVINVIDDYRNNRNVYVLGSTNVGKSSLMNAMLRASGLLDYDLITTSIIPATTINLIKIPFFEKNVLYDTPGLVNESNILSLAESADFKKIMPKQEIRARIYQLNNMQSLMIEGFACFNFIEGEKTSFVCYFSNSLEIQRSKLAKANELFFTRAHELFEFKSEFEYETKELEIVKESEIVIEGLGFILVKGRNLKVSVIVPKGCGVSVREPLIGWKN